MPLLLDGHGGLPEHAATPLWWRREVWVVGFDAGGRRADDIRPLSAELRWSGPDVPVEPAVLR